MRFRTLMLAVAVLAPGMSALGDTVYSTAAAYAAATAGSSTTTINFNGIAATNSFVKEPNPFSLSGATFSFGTTSNAYIVDPGYYNSSYAGGGFLEVDHTSPANILTVSFSPVNELSFNYGGLFEPTGPFVITLSDGFTTTLSDNLSLGANPLDFAGITSSSPITSVTFTLPDAPYYSVLDNVSFGTSVTPEPSSFVLLGTGLLGIAGAVRRRLR